MDILVTGCDGFVGRHMVEELSARGHNVHTIDLPFDAVDAFTNDHYTGRHFELVVHCAYNVGGRVEINNNRQNLAKNLLLDAALFDWAIQTERAARILYFSSPAVYPVQMQGPPRWTAGDLLHESHTDPLASTHSPDADYGWAKLTGERLAHNARELGQPVTIVRPFSGYGADQGLEYPFPAIIQRAREKVNPFPVWGKKGSTRDWIHISDVINGALAVVESKTDETVNLCTGRPTSFEDLATLAMLAAGYEGKVIEVEGSPAGVYHRVGDPSRMTRYYYPEVRLEDAVIAAVRGERLP